MTDPDTLLTDKRAFESFVYTPWRQALSELEQRRTDTRLSEIVREIQGGQVLPCLDERQFVAMFRNLATPNHEAYRFRIVSDVMPGLRPILFEYRHDKFADINPSKRALGKLCFYKRLAKNATPIYHYKRILDIEHANGKPINELHTLSGNDFITFHHSFFRSVFGEYFDLEDISEWLSAQGQRPHHYYLPFLSLFIRDGILLENFLFTEEEKRFSREIVIPAIVTLAEKTGYKPLIVALEPTDIEGDTFWTSYPESIAHLCTP